MTANHEPAIMLVSVPHPHDAQGLFTSTDARKVDTALEHASGSGSLQQYGGTSLSLGEVHLATDQIQSEVAEHLAHNASWTESGAQQAWQTLSVIRQDSTGDTSWSQLHWLSEGEAVAAPRFCEDSGMDGSEADKEEEEEEEGSWHGASRPIFVRPQPGAAARTGEADETDEAAVPTAHSLPPSSQSSNTPRPLVSPATCDTELAASAPFGDKCLPGAASANQPSEGAVSPDPHWMVGGAVGPGVHLQDPWFWLVLGAVAWVSVLRRSPRRLRRFTAPISRRAEVTPGGPPMETVMKPAHDGIRGRRRRPHKSAETAVLAHGNDGQDAERSHHPPLPALPPSVVGPPAVRGLNPEAFVCPITGELMRDPVVNAAGHMYERANIEEWLALHDTDPCTNVELPSKALTPLHAVRAAILEFLKEPLPVAAQQLV